MGIYLPETSTLQITNTYISFRLQKHFKRLIQAGIHFSYDKICPFKPSKNGFIEGDVFENKTR